MIDPDDRIAVAVSGGKDSLALHALLIELSRRAPIPFTVVAVHVDQGMPGHDTGPLVEYMRAHDFELHVERDDTYPALLPLITKGKSPCPLCSRLRRAILYRITAELGCTKLALGHHRQDVLSTLLLNLMYSGQLKAMPPKLVSDDKRTVVIRPLAFASQDDIRAYALQHELPVLPPPTCGASRDSQRKVVERLLADLEMLHPDTQNNMMAALANVRPSHLFDVRLWKALGLDVAVSHRDEILTDGS